MATRIANYEAMFLISQAHAAQLGDTVAHIRHTLERYHATIVAMRKWDERRLAYEIQKQKRGLYILCYFSCDTKHLGEIERAFNLSESVMRHLIIRADHLSMDEMKAADAARELEAEAKLRASQPAMPLAVSSEPEPVNAGDEDEDM
ncbi:MAG: 30S ribosomal protein S6 [Phycisphaerales bacterium]|nr:30S ribosomal protein S6 [Phycisphaerales bacterium]